MMDTVTRDSIQSTFDYLRERAASSGSRHTSTATTSTSGPATCSPSGVAFFDSLASLHRERPVQAGLVVLCELTIHGSILPVRSLAEPLQPVMDNGAKEVLLPTANKRDLLEVPGDIVERVDSLFYSNPLQASVKALG